MSQSYKGVEVAFAKDVSEETAEIIMNAIRCLRGVLEVRPIKSTSADWIVEDRVRQAYKDKLFRALDPKIADIRDRCKLE
jgi:hypothetical protein